MTIRHVTEKSSANYVVADDSSLFLPSTKAEVEPQSSPLAEVIYSNAGAVKEAAKAYAAQRSISRAIRDSLAQVVHVTLWGAVSRRAW